MEGAFVADGVVAASVRQIRVERTAAIDVRAEDVGIRHRPVGHRVLTTELQLTVWARDTHPRLTPEQTPALPGITTAGVETAFESEYRFISTAQIFGTTQAPARR